MGVGQSPIGNESPYFIIEFRAMVKASPCLMHPPNLKIEARCKYEIESGITAGDNREFLVGFEGSDLTSDTNVAVSIQWLD